MHHVVIDELSKTMRREPMFMWAHRLVDIQPCGEGHECLMS